MKFVYQARTKEGKIDIGTVEASSKEAAALLLQKYDIIVTSLREQATFSKREFFFGRKVSKKDLAIFSRQLAVMLQSRVPVVQSLKSLAVQMKNPSFKEKIAKTAQFVEEGNSLSESFAKYPEVFNVFYTSLLKTGEASGKISDALYYLSDHLERESDIISKIRSAMVYPIFVLGTLMVMVLIVIFFLMPRLVDLLNQTISNPPLFTSLMISFYTFLSSYGWILVLSFLGLIAFFSYYFTTQEGKKRFDALSLKIPFVKEFFKKVYLIRFAENIATLISAGLSINSSLKITKDTINNVVYKKVISEVEQGVLEGQKISYILKRYPELFPPFVIQMIQVGEETGKSSQNLMEIVNFYNKEVDRALVTFTTLLEPILIIFLGIIVAFLAASVIAPLYSALNVL